MSRYVNILLLLNVIWCNADLSTKFKICSRSDPKLNDCLKSAIQSALAVLKNGFPDLNIAPLEPIRFPKYSAKATEELNFNQEYTNIEMHDHVSSEIKEVNAVIDDTKFSLNIKMFNPKVRYNSDYNYQNAMLGGIDLSGKGKTTTTATDFHCTIDFKGEVRNNGGTEYLFITDATVSDADVEDMHITYESENVEAGKELTKIFNEHWKVLVTKNKKKFTPIYAEAYKNEANSIFAKIPYNTLFPK